MAFAFKGFPDEQLARGIMADVMSVVDKTDSAIRANDTKYKVAAATWFGTLSTADAATLKTGVHSIQRAFSRASFNVVYGTNCAAGENARVEHYTGQDVVGQTSSDIRSNRTLTDSAKLELMLCARMFERRYPRVKTNEQCQLQVVLHEMSHHGAGTIDVLDTRAGAGAGAKLYELSGAKHARASGTAIQNAENWGFFMMEFYNLINPH